MHTVALADDGTVWSWGVNDEGALGRQTTGEIWEKAPERVRPHGICNEYSFLALRLSFDLDLVAVHAVRQVLSPWPDTAMVRSTAVLVCWM